MHDIEDHAVGWGVGRQPIMTGGVQERIGEIRLTMPYIEEEGFAKKGTEEETTRRVKAG